jgi:phage-related holin
MSSIKAALAFCASWALEMAGHPETAALSLLSLLMADLALGVIRSWRQQTFRGKRLVVGAFKFFRYWVAIALFVTADQALEKAIPGFDVNLSNFFIAYLSMNELGSCLEHLAYFGLPMPDPMKQRLQKYREVLSGQDKSEVE